MASHNGLVELQKIKKLAEESIELAHKSRVLAHRTFNNEDWTDAHQERLEIRWRRDEIKQELKELIESL